MPMFKIRLTRLIEQEATVMIRAINEESAQEKALEDLPANGVWSNTDCEPASYGAEVIPSDGGVENLSLEGDMTGTV